MTEIDIAIETSETVDIEVEDVIQTGGSGTNNYNHLSNKPSINGVVLTGNKTLEELGVTEDVYKFIEAHKEELKGKDGNDGFSPSATVQQMVGGAVITISDKNGTTSAVVSNGVDGKDGEDGQNGKDYVITPNDYDNIADVVLGKLTVAESVNV